MTHAAFIAYLLIVAASAAVMAWACFSARHVARKHGPGMVVFLAVAVWLGHFLTAEEKEQRAGVIFYRTDPDFVYLVDRGSYVLADEVQVSMQIRGLPDDASIQLWYTPLTETNWVCRSDETVADWQPFYNADLQCYYRSFDYFGAGSNRWCIFTTYIRPSQVLTNGVLHVVGVQCDAGTNAVAGVPLHTGVTVDGQSIDLKTRLDARTMTNEEENE